MRAIAVLDDLAAHFRFRMNHGVALGVNPEVPRGSIAFELEEQQRTRNRCVDSRAVLLDQRVQTWICTAPVVALIAHAAYGGEIQSGISSRECNEADAVNAARRSALMPPGRPDQLARLIDQL